MEKNQLRSLIERVLKEMRLYSPEAVELLMGTAATESALGYYIKQVKGPALGIFQMEPNTEWDIWKNYIEYKPQLKNMLVEYIGMGLDELYDGDVVQDLEFNLAYQIIMARIHYMRVSEPLPAVDDVEGQAAYWKKHYNTSRGAGTEAKYIAAYNKFVKGA